MEIQNLKKGVRDGMPICIGYFSVSFAFGIFATGQGLSVLEAVMISLFNLTSAGQLAATPIIASFGSIPELVISQLVINMRYALMSVSLSQKLGESVRLRDRFWISFANTDEVFAVSMANYAPVGRRYMLGLIIPPILGWTGGTLVGALAGNILPEIVIIALGIAIYGMFISIVMPFARGTLVGALCVLSAIALSSILYYVPLLSKIPSGFSIIITAVAISALFALIAPIPDDTDDTDENGASAAGENRKQKSGESGEQEPLQEPQEQEEQETKDPQDIREMQEKQNIQEVRADA